MVKLSRLTAAAALVASATTATTAFAQPQPPQIVAPVGKWTLDFGEKRCSLARRTGGENSPIFVLSSYLGRDEPEILIMRAGGEAVPRLPERVRITLMPSGQTEEARAMHHWANEEASVQIMDIREGFFDRFARSESIRVGTDRGEVLTLPLPAISNALTALKACNDDLLKSWGIDVDVRNRLSRQPRQIAGYISASDYPTRARRQGQTGISVVSFIVGVDGRVTGCKTAVSSGHPLLDEETCRIMTDRVRYEPALDANGRPVAVGEVRTITWSLPRGGRRR